MDLVPLFSDITDLNEADTMRASALDSVLAEVIEEAKQSGGKDPREVMQQLREQRSMTQFAYGEVVTAVFIDKLRSLIRKNLGSGHDLCFFSFPSNFLSENWRALRFLDVGSGTGKAVVACASLIGMESTGVEIVEELHHIAQKFTAVGLERGLLEDERVDFRCSSFEDVDFSSFDIVFCNCASWDAQLMDQLAACCSKGKSGALILTIFKELSERASVRKLSTVNILMSWSTTTMHVYLKL